MFETLLQNNCILMWLIYNSLHKVNEPFFLKKTVRYRCMSSIIQQPELDSVNLLEIKKQTNKKKKSYALISPLGIGD